MKRGAIRQDECVFIGAWLPIPQVASLDEAVRIKDSDRSKLIREALTEKIRKTLEPEVVNA